MRTLKTGFLLTALTLILLFGGEALAGRQGMTFGLILAVFMNGMAYFFSDKIALASSGARPVSREQAPRLYAVMERLAAKGNLPMPKLYVIPQAAPNAFATGRNPSHASVAATEGLLELMTDDELEGVIAHELSHVRNYDILTTSIAATLAGLSFGSAHAASVTLTFDYMATNLLGSFASASGGTAVPVGTLTLTDLSDLNLGDGKTGVRSTLTLNGRSGLLGSYLPYGDPRRGWDFRAPGHGGIDWEAVIRALNEIGYDGPLAVEFKDAGMDRASGADEACKFVKRLDFEPARRGGEAFR